MKKHWLLYWSVFILELGTSCKKEFSCENCTPSIAGDSLFYYRVNIDGVKYEAEAFQNHAFIVTEVAWTQRINRDSGVVIGSVLQTNTAAVTLAEGLTFEKGVIKNFSSLSLSDFQNIFKPGEYPYADLKTVPPFSQFLENGIAIRWDDENATIWRSDYAPADQTGSRFTIKKRENVSYSFTGGDTFPMRVMAEFDCKVYDTAGRSKIINGELAFLFRKDP